MDTSFAISTGAMRVTQIRHDVTGNNVANINTDGFQQSDVIQKETNPGVDIADIRKTPNNGPYSNTDFAKEAKEMIVNKDAYGANGKVIKVQDQMLGEAINLIG
ncbi:MAG: hypothetical protein A2350_13080 [Candidatus Raymondbacteria bacterium RifOxyB12_full_50_8]|uniref:Flagellar basal body rod protein N-terminal domain-containing protein n=1 Tax=Candidatus Raymondbacteria bacterium RIFOXYD12_FULL_49_13 TaxID=1817890 RepID=A0A1F7F0C4_UNCRA|nr:MAG: hypothetical protein A2248_21845 [Candidatus Raymondbacteria bacterium RIFOXYA2_FULL_49_16]OGK00081.1 MAG: hypothetical protein A2519_22400 [Candidatus Raymondbacteria bacterium RIFOXYD12_FULL_49_13]OGK03697.1 MAG: hypothetical protein A2350_13080 [Candidatus Raymondbacteria bacterium RifOxyB12_full_50_8]OGP45070.1 MAG: hypothetical protein A2324_13725 [Candidatus Raymondbacteria bacterium RIFOXYB2_FULL_49_35]